MENYTVTIEAEMNRFFIGPVDSEFLEEPSNECVMSPEGWILPEVIGYEASLFLIGDPTDPTIHFIFSLGKMNELPEEITAPHYTFELPVKKPITAVGGFPFEWPIEERGEGFALPEGKYLAKLYFKFGEECISEEDFAAGLGATNCYVEFYPI